MGKLGNIEQIPQEDSLESLILDEEDIETLKNASLTQRHIIAAKYLDINELDLAWKILVLKK